MYLKPFNLKHELEGISRSGVIINQKDHVIAIDLFMAQLPSVPSTTGYSNGSKTTKGQSAL